MASPMDERHHLERGQRLPLDLLYGGWSLGRPVVTTEALVPLRGEAVESDTYVAWFPMILISARASSSTTVPTYHWRL